MGIKNKAIPEVVIGNLCLKTDLKYYFMQTKGYYKNMILKNLGKVLLGKAALAAALPFLLLAGAMPAFGQSAEIRTAGVYYINGASDINSIYCNWSPESTESPSAYRGGVTNVGGHATNDPWDTSALIEYDQPYPSATSSNSYPNHCLALCFDVYCTNKPNGSSTYSVSFPLQRARFEIARYFGSKDISNADNSPAVRTIDMSILENKIGTASTQADISKYSCAAYTCYGASAKFEYTTTCPNPVWECTSQDQDASCKNLTTGVTTNAVTAGCDPKVTCHKLGDGELTAQPHTCIYPEQGYLASWNCNCNGAETPCIVRSGGSPGKGYNDPIRFCAAWDGSHEVLGEFGKINGQYGFRANVQSKYPGDGIAVENIEIDDTFIYPGNNQFPIQVDVTNVHTVRTTPTVMGAITAVEATPYSVAYRLSKDADVLIKIYDASKLNSTPTKVVRTLVDWQPRLGEGMLGSEKDKPVVESEMWDGRDDNGRLLPANNYMISIQARSMDEWTPTKPDYSRAVTRQLSMDPLKLTDISVKGLSKQSTAYATIKYVPTEASNVYFNVYSPGTVFASEYTNGINKSNTDNNTGTGPTISNNSGVLVYSSVQERGRGASYPDKWDGLCHNTAGCAIPFAKGSVLPISGKVWDGTASDCNNSNEGGRVSGNNCVVTFADGSPLPDGDYVYALWAEVPYTDTYQDAAGYTYRAVKTQLYYIGLLPVERGLVDITIQPVSYSTIGSSPTAYGLDPFIFKYSVARESIVNAYVQNTAGVTVKTLTNEGGNTAVAQQMNTLTWDGLDDNGRMVGPGTYLFVVEAADPMFPLSKVTQASAQFPVDLYRITNVSTTDVYGDSEAKATISYMLSKAMNVQISIYNKDVVIPVPVSNTTTKWPPHVCNHADDAAFFTGGYVNPATNPTCIYINDTSFTSYPDNATAAVNVRLQPVKTFDRSALRTGNGMRLTEEWDAQYFYNPTSEKAACTNATNITTCPYEMVPDGTYPFYVAASTDEPMDIYYDMATGRPLRSTETIKNVTGWNATEKPVYRVNITRGPVYFLDGSVSVYPNAPQLFNTSSGPVFVPPYEINFAISRAATVEVAVVALKPNMCTTTKQAGTPYSQLPYDNKAGDVCKYLSTMTIPNTGTFDPNIERRIYWDGTDNNGKYVKNGNYEFRLIAKNYPDEGLYQPTIKQFTQSVDLLKVFDLPDSEAYAINERGKDMNISYQLSVPMKVGIQIFKPGTTIYDYAKGTLRDPSTGQEVQDINDVLVKSIVGIRPSTTLIEEVWDGTDYSGHEVPDGTYPFRFVTALNSADIDSITGEIVGDYATTDGQSTNPAAWKINKVADTWQYVNLHHATVAIGDGQFVCEDWERTVFFYPNPFKTPTGTMEITKLPVPGRLSIKLYNLAGDLVREGGYTCVDAQNMMVTMGNNLEVSPDNNPAGSHAMTPAELAAHRSIRNPALRCFWDRTNDHGKKVARGVYFGLVDFRATNGRQHCQKVVKILIPR